MPGDMLLREFKYKLKNTTQHLSISIELYKDAMQQIQILKYFIITHL